jgi:microcystin-dependent protein
MSDPYIGEIRIFANNYAPYGWVSCTGALLQISQYQPLFAVIGTTYGGNGQTTFAVPNLNKNGVQFAPVGTGASSPEGISYDLNEQDGAASASLSIDNLPSHTHSIIGILSDKPHTVADPTGNRMSRYLPAPANSVYSNAAANCPMSSKMLGIYGGGLVHENRQPALSLNFYIAWSGVFPIWDN